MADKEQLHIQSQRIRVMTFEDLAMVLSWRNHPDIRRYMYTQHEITLEEHNEWFEGAANSPCKHLLIFELNYKPFGFVQITQFKKSPVAEWGFYVAPNSPKGTGRSLGQSAMKFAFDDLGLHKICGQALAYNEPSIQFHGSLGFQTEGRLRQQHFDGQNYHDVLCFGLLAHEWKKASKDSCREKNN